MADVSCIAMEHQDRNILLGALVWWSDVEGGKLLAIRGRNHKLFEVGDTELRGSGNRCAGFVRDMGRIDKSFLLEI